MGRKLGYVMVLLALSLSASAASQPGAITGFVRNSAGVAQMGAMVEVVARASQAMTVFTDARGYFAASGLIPGTYYIKVTAPSFLPALRENVALKAGASVLVNVTLNTLFEAIQLLPARHGAQDEEGWKWTLRSAANRPILRVLDNGPVVVSQANEADKTLKARVAFVAGSDAEGFGSSAEMSTRFSVERALFTAGTLSVKGNVGYGGGLQSGVVRASYVHRMPDGSTPELSLTARRFANPDLGTHSEPFQAMTVRLADSATFGNLLGLHFGTEFQTIQFMGRVSSLKPFGSADVHLGPNTVVEYQYASAEPKMHGAKGFDSAASDLAESGPRVSMVERNAVLERARHQEVSLSQRVAPTRTSVQLAAYSDHIKNTALTGAGEMDSPIAELLPDLYSGTFTYNGGELDTKGMRFVVQQKLPADMLATVNYSYGGVLDLTASDVSLHSIHSSIHQEWRHSVGGKLAGTLPRTHTHWATSYRWISENALTPVDMFDNSPGQMDPYWNVFIRQPLPAPGFLPGKMEALIDLRNLLAQGYVPVIGHDGRTVYLVQSARSVRGGLAFVF